MDSWSSAKFILDSPSSARSAFLNHAAKTNRPQHRVEGRHHAERIRPIDQLGEAAVFALLGQQSFQKLTRHKTGTRHRGRVAVKQDPYGAHRIVGPLSKSPLKLSPNLLQRTIRDESSCGTQVRCGGRRRASPSAFAQRWVLAVVLTSQIDTLGIYFLRSFSFCSRALLAPVPPKSGWSAPTAPLPAFAFFGRRKMA